MGSNLIQEKFESAKDKSRTSLMEESKQDVLQLLRGTVRPEFLNRIDEIIMFTPLNAEEIKSIVKIQLDQVKNRLQEQQIDIDFTPEAISQIASDGFDPQFGARPVKRVVQRQVLNKLSKEILAGNIHPNSNILIDCFEQNLVFRNK